MEMGKNPKFWVCVRFEFCKRRVRVWFGSISSLMELERCFAGGRLLRINNCRYLNLFSQSTVKCLVFTVKCVNVAYVQFQSVKELFCSLLYSAGFASVWVLAHFTLRTRCGTVCCNRSCLWVGMFVCVCMWLCYHDSSKLRALIWSSPNWVCR